ncbi:hypothetical protein WAK64_20545 [Bacillus spongiae]|uniref:AP2 domain-containing protein n=1 Tax=Bacillus spongiae TaxID=2683610 RepID=A0ABU8HJP1_9BACI
MKGERFGKWLVIEKVEGSKPIKWLCRCDCGKEKEVSQNNLKRGKSSSCGCFRKEKLRELKSVHNCQPEKLYGVWLSMKRRCDLKSSPSYINYGARGIRVVDEWKSDYAVFRDWAFSNGYEEGLSIDRINNDGNYSPDNCRWVDRRTQNLNKRTNRNITIDGVTRTVTEWSEQSGINRKTIQSRINYGWKDEELLTETEGIGTNATTTKRNK